MSLLPAAHPRTPFAIPIWVIGAAIALLAALGLGDPTPEHRLMLGGMLGAGVLVATALAPLTGYLVLAASCVMMVVVSVGTGEHNVMPFDVLLLPLIAGAVLAWITRRPPLAVDVPAPAGTALGDLQRATRRFTDGAWLYAAVGLGSLFVTVLMGEAHGALDSGFKLARAVEGMLMFGVGMACVRDERAVGKLGGALVAGGVLFAAVNFAALALQPLTSDNTIRRAGMTWFVNEPGWSIADPNEAGIALLLLWAVLMGRQIHRPRLFGWLMMALTLGLLVLTQSRSSLLAWLTFTVLTWRQLPRRALVFGAVAMLVAAPFVTTVWWTRMARTVSGDRGSFEMYTTLVRVYGWWAAGRMFLGHPLVGVGYLGFRHFSDRYNELGLVLGTCESFFLETATGMGIVGLFVFFRALWRTAVLGDVVAKHAPQGSLAATLARLHKPYLIALMVSNLTGDNWTGLVGLAQTAVWCLLLVRAGQFAVSGRTEP